MSLQLTSAAFAHEGTIPEQYSKQGGNVSPQLSWTGVPEGTSSLVLIAEDPDAPSGTFVHWLVYGIPPDVHSLDERQPQNPVLANSARQGLNGYGEIGYGGPKPPGGTHRYYFRLFALDTDSDLPIELTRDELEGVIQGHIIEQAELMGRFSAS